MRVRPTAERGPTAEGLIVAPAASLRRSRSVVSVERQTAVKGHLSLLYREGKAEPAKWCRGKEHPSYQRFNGQVFELRLVDSFSRRTAKNPRSIEAIR